MSTIENKANALVVLFDGFKPVKRPKWQKWSGPDTPHAEFTGLTLYFNQVRVVGRYAFVSLDDVLDKNGEPLEIQIPMAHIKRGKKFLSRGRNYHNDRFTISGPSIGRVAFFCR